MVAVGLLSLLTGVLLVHSGARDVVGAAAATGLIVHPVVLASALLIYLHWRLSGGRLARWLTVGLVMMSVPGLTMAGVFAVDPTAADRGRWWPLVVQAGVLAALLAVTVVSTRNSVRVNPLAAGAVGGFVLSAGGLGLVLWAPGLSGPTWVNAVLSALPPLIAVVIAVGIMRRPRLPWGGRAQLALGLVLLTIGDTATFSVLDLETGSIVTLATSILGAALLTGASLSLVRTSILDAGKEMAGLNERLIAVESAAREHRARLHEIGSTVAGITSASRLMREPTVILTGERRALLEGMLESELARLERLMTSTTETPRGFDVDDVLRQLVVAQHAQGRVVHWEPSGCRALGRPDDLAEAVHVLLDNAAKHGGNVGATVETRELDGVVEIVVSDLGPGIAADVRSHVFDWGTRSRSSSGQGIGLTIARNLLEQQGGYLLLKESPAPGATFTVGLQVG